jgi:hypothetical protein
MHRREHRERGVALVVTIVLLVILLGLSAAFVLLADARMEETRAIRDGVHAALLAEGAVAIRVDDINTGVITEEQMTANAVPTWAFGGEPSHATIDVDAQNHPLVVGLNGSAGAYRTSTTIEVAIRPRIIPRFGVAVGGTERIDLKTNVNLDSYDSTEAAYPESAGQNGDIGSGDGADMQLQGNISIQGDLSCGGDLTYDDGTQVTGLVTEDDPIEFENIDDLIEQAMTDIVANSDNEHIIAAVQNSGGAWQFDNQLCELSATINSPPPLVLPAGNYNLCSITTKQQGIIRFGPGKTAVSISESVDMSQQSGFYVDQGGEVVIYFGGKGSMSIAQSGTIDVENGVQDATRLLVYGHSDAGTLKLSQNGVYIGGFYWLGADVRVQSNVEIYGALIGGDVDIASNVNVHFDDALRSIGRPGSYGRSTFRRLIQD